MSKRLTHEEYVKRVQEINPNIEVLGVYAGYKTKILHKCKIDGYEWYVTPTSILQGHGCPMCYGGVKKTHEQYVEELSVFNPLIIIIGKYINSSTPILHKCKIDGCKWFATPNNILQGKGCPLCGGTLHKTHERYADELKTKNPLLAVVGKYINRTTKIMHKCLIHNYEWEITPASALKGCGCPICTMEKARNRLAKCHADYVKEVSLINSDIEVLESYINSTTRIKHRCLVCGFEWDAFPSNILKGHCCPICARKTAGEHRKMSHEEYVLNVTKINPNIKVVGEYISAKIPILHRCNIDGREWLARPSDVLHGIGCPKCRASKGEKKISYWLEQMDILYQSQMIFEDCKNIKPLPFDFYLSDYNICIEYQGKQHYEPIEHFGGEQTFEKQMLRDKIKKEYCKNNNIILFEIPYYSDLDKELEDLYKLITMLNTQKGVSKVA